MSALPRPRCPDVEDVLAAYRADLLAAGMYAGHLTLSYARTFLTCVGIEGWRALPLDQQCATSLKDRRVVGWLVVTGRLRPTADYLVVGKPYVGEIAARHHRAFHQRFTTASAELGSPSRSRSCNGLRWSRSPPCGRQDRHLGVLPAALGVGRAEGGAARQRAA